MFHLTSIMGRGQNRVGVVRTVGRGQKRGTWSEEWAWSEPGGAWSEQGGVVRTVGRGQEIGAWSEPGGRGQNRGTSVSLYHLTVSRLRSKSRSRSVTPPRK